MFSSNDRQYITKDINELMTQIEDIRKLMLNLTKDCNEIWHRDLEILERRNRIIRLGLDFYATLSSKIQTFKISLTQLKLEKTELDIEAIFKNVELIDNEIKESLGKINADVWNYSFNLRKIQDTMWNIHYALESFEKFLNGKYPNLKTLSEQPSQPTYLILDLYKMIAVHLPILDLLTPAIYRAFNLIDATNENPKANEIVLHGSKKLEINWVNAFVNQFPAKISDDNCKQWFVMSDRVNRLGLNKEWKESEDDRLYALYCFTVDDIYQINMERMEKINSLRNALFYVNTNTRVTLNTLTRENHKKRYEYVMTTDAIAKGTSEREVVSFLPDWLMDSLNNTQTMIKQAKFLGTLTIRQNRVEMYYPLANLSGLQLNFFNPTRITGQFKDSNLKNSTFVNCEFDYSSKFNYCNLMNSTLKDCNFIKTKLFYTNLSVCQSTAGTSFKFVTLSNAVLPVETNMLAMMANATTITDHNKLGDIPLITLYATPEWALSQVKFQFDTMYVIDNENLDEYLAGYKKEFLKQLAVHQFANVNEVQKVLSVLVRKDHILRIDRGIKTNGYTASYGTALQILAERFLVSTKLLPSHEIDLKSVNLLINELKQWNIPNTSVFKTSGREKNISLIKKLTALNDSCRKSMEETLNIQSKLSQ